MILFTLLCGHITSVTWLQACEMHTGQACTRTYVYTFKQMHMYKRKHTRMQMSHVYICLCSTDGVVFLVVVTNWTCMHTNLIIIYERLHGKSFFIALRKATKVYIPNMIIYILYSA